ncbi:MAG TPA: SMC family ATPase, partial [Thermosynechococcaceae cyanobacterium]
MEILSVTLKNFKSHSDRCFEFKPGTNAICGENGAGKTSILEAIAWTLFDYTGSYSKEDLVRNGSASAQARLAFVSSRDGRTYEVQRCTSKGYTLYDPQLDERLPYSRIKEEVLPWLREHLGVSPGTDLAKLFASTIGVPQGTFTADFLLSKENRKPIFNKVLKIEEYLQTWKDLGDLERYAKHQVERLQEQVSRYEEDLQDLDRFSQEGEIQRQEIQQVQGELRQAETEVRQLEAEQNRLSAEAEQLQQRERDLKQLDQQRSLQAQVLKDAQQDWQQTENAVAICTRNKAAYAAYTQAEEALKTLQQSWLSEQKLQKEKQQLERQLGDRRAHLTSLSLQLEQLAATRQEIIRLEPLSQQQTQLEQSQQNLSQQLQHCQSWRRSLQDREKSLRQVQMRQTQLHREIAEVQILETAVQEIPLLEQQQQRLQEQLSRIAAATQFEADLRRLLSQATEGGDRYQVQVQHTEAALRNLQRTVPGWAAALDLALNTLHTGTTWQQQITAALQEILDDLTEQTSVEKLKQQHRTIDQHLRLARQQQIKFASLERLQVQQSQLETDLQDLQTSLTELQSQLATEPLLLQQQADLTQQWEALDDPKGRRRLHQADLRQEPELRMRAQVLQASLKESEQAIAHVDTQLAAFADLADEMQQQQQTKQTHQWAYDEYLSFRELANTRKERRPRLQAAIAQLQAIDELIQVTQVERDRLGQTFDPVEFQAVQTAYQTAKERTLTLRVRLPELIKAMERLDRDIARLQAIQQTCVQAKAELIQKRQTDRFVKVARKIYKEAGPKIAKRYIHTISLEADRLFRELLNRPNVGLEWTEDYDVVVQEGAHVRRMVNLSGGEQMCAALAVRLALLKVLADIDVAFFDEPTTNMDR